jgi:hypothetical protein
MFNRYSLVPAALALALTAQSVGAQGLFAKDPFTDVPANHAQHEAVEYLRKNNVLRGYPDGTFRPDQRINRAEFVKLITNPFILDTTRMNECIAANTDEGDTTIFFPDVARDSWYAAEVCHAKDTELIDGYPDGYFRPGNYILFVEAAKILSNTFAFQTDQEPEVWYGPYVKKLDELNAIPTSIDRYDHTLTRGEMAEMLFRLKAQRTDKASRASGQIK